MTPQSGLVWSCSEKDLAVKAHEHGNESPGCVKAGNLQSPERPSSSHVYTVVKVDLINENQKFIITQNPTIWMFIWVNPD
jgi:hypothetical protein